VSLADRLERLGLSADEAATRAAIVAAVAHRLRTLTGGPPEWAWFVPGRLEVFGKHTDYRRRCRAGSPWLPGRGTISACAWSIS
jgi:hypothetical protein